MPVDTIYNNLNTFMFSHLGGKCLCGAQSSGALLCGECSSKAMGVGRMLLAIIFVVGGYGKLTGFMGTVGYIDGAGFPAAMLLAGLAVVFELGGGLLLLVGKYTAQAAVALLIFVALATLMFHTSGLGEQMQQIALLKNLAIMGGLFYVLSAGAGAWSYDNKKRGQF